jgi:hypothetical protein
MATRVGKRRLARHTTVLAAQFAAPRAAKLTAHAAQPRITPGRTPTSHPAAQADRIDRYNVLLICGFDT